MTSQELAFHAFAQFGGGLHKLEPSELANVPADEIANLISGYYTFQPQQLVLCERE